MLRHLCSLLRAAKDLDLQETIREQMLVWSTFANQLSAEHREGREVLSEAHRLLMEAIAELPRGSREWETCWRILIVGWDQLCRSTEQQVAAMRLALSQEELTRERAGSDAEKGDSERTEAKVFESLYTELLGKSSPSRKLRSPLELLFARFFRSHSSFFELETLNKSTVRSYLVLLDAQIYSKAEKESQVE